VFDSTDLANRVVISLVSDDESDEKSDDESDDESE
jgi:hypothetical protein